MAKPRRRQLKQKRRTSVNLRCRDCRVDTSHVKEWYMVTHDVWASIATKREQRIGLILCIGCLEQRLGRLLTPVDFIDCLVNAGFLGASQRMRDRVGLDGEPDMAKMIEILRKSREIAGAV